MHFLEMMVGCKNAASGMYSEYSFDKIVRKVNAFRDLAHVQENEDHVPAVCYQECVVVLPHETIRINYFLNNKRK